MDARTLELLAAAGAFVRRSAFPLALIACNLGAAVAALLAHDWRRATYWLASAVCLAAVAL